MTIELIENFLCVARHSSITAAAEELMISQSALSKQIRMLEEQLGAELFLRAHRTIKLTSSGAALQRMAPSFLENYRNICGAVSSQRQVSLRIATLPILENYGLASLCARFANSRPDIDIKIDEMQNEDLLAALMEDRCDIAIMRTTREKLSGLSTFTIGTDELVLVMPAGHPLAGKHTVSLSQLRDERFLFLGRETQLYQSSLDACRHAGFEPRIMYCGSSSSSIASLVVDGGGIAIMMRMVAKEICGPRIKILQFTETQQSRLVMARRRTEQSNKNTGAFWKYMQDQIKGESACRS